MTEQPKDGGAAIWIMKVNGGFYPIEPSKKCKPEDHGRLNPHVLQIEDIDGNILWKREATK